MGTTDGLNGNIDGLNGNRNIEMLKISRIISCLRIFKDALWCGTAVGSVSRRTGVTTRQVGASLSLSHERTGTYEVLDSSITGFFLILARSEQKITCS
jgi:hypothetical protein